MERLDRLHLFVGTPCYGGVVTQPYMEAVFSLALAAASAGLRLSLTTLGQDALITRSRNTLVQRFRRTDATHLLFADADIGFAPEDVFRLLEHGRDVVGGLYPIRASFWDDAARHRVEQGEDPETAAFRYVGEPSGSPSPNGLVPARYAGTGFLLISRDAIERLIEAHPETRCRHLHVAQAGDRGDATTQPDDAELYALFDCLIDPETRAYLSEDYAFCSRWRAIGGTIWLDPTLTLSHHGMGEFRGKPAVRINGN